MDKFNYIANQQLPDKKVIEAKKETKKIFIPQDREIRQQWLEHYIKYDPVMNNWFSNKLIRGVGLADEGLTGVLPLGSKVISALLAKCLEVDDLLRQNGRI